MEYEIGIRIDVILQNQEKIQAELKLQKEALKFLCDKKDKGDDKNGTKEIERKD